MSEVPSGGVAKSAQYLGALAEVRALARELEAGGRPQLIASNSAWSDYWKKWTQDGRLLLPHLQDGEARLAALPRLLALVHPDHYYDRVGRALGAHLVPSFTPDAMWGRAERDQSCESVVLEGVPCPLEPGRRSGSVEPIEADHLWPHALGGPSTASNRLWLCRTHNMMKASSVYLFAWTKYPQWLNQYLSCLHELKRG